MQLVKHGDGFEDIKPLPCNAWDCDYCAPRRKRRLLAQAAGGEPNKMLTLTVNPAVGSSPLDRRNLLHDAFKRLVKRILRQFALEPEKRWKLTNSTRSTQRAWTIDTITAKTARLVCTKIHYFAFLEATKLGEPHLHILLRCPFLPQDWIAEQMQEMTNAPICDIRQIRSTRAAIFYVTKYCTKAPAQFGKTRRYWISRAWEVNPDPDRSKPVMDMTGVSVRRRRWEDQTFAFQYEGVIFRPLIDGWLRIYPRGTPLDAWGQDTEPEYEDA